MTNRPNSTIFALVLLIFGILTTAVILAFAGPAKASTGTAIVSTLLATLAPTISTVFLIGQVAGVKKDTKQSVEGIEHVLNGTMDAKIVNAVEATLKAHGVVPSDAPPALDTALETIKEVTESRK